MTDTELVLSVLALGAVYFAPSIIAIVRAHKNTVAITLLNFLLGWTFVGWVGALVWSATAQR